MNLLETTLSSQVVYKGKILTLKKDQVRLPNGGTGTREVVVHNGAVCIAPIDKEGNVILVAPVPVRPLQELLELPAGKMTRRGLPRRRCAGAGGGDRLHCRGASVPGDILPLCGVFDRGDPPVCGHRPHPEGTAPGPGRIPKGGKTPLGPSGETGVGRGDSRRQDPGPPSAGRCTFSSRGTPPAINSRELDTIEIPKQ